MKSPIWKTHENCEGSISSTPRIRNSQKPSRTRVRSWKHQLLLLCPVKLRKIVGLVQTNKIQTELACILEADESTRMRMENSEPHNHEDHIAGKGENSLQHYNLVHRLFFCLELFNSCSRSSGGQELGKIGDNFDLELDKVKSKKQVIDEARMSGTTVHFASLMDICHLKC